MFGRVLIVLLAAALAWAVLAHDGGASGKPRYHTVRAGETLWSIAAAAYGGDPREGVWKLRTRNGLADATIAPGERLVVP